MATTVILVDSFRAWLVGLDAHGQEVVGRSIEVLALEGVNLKRPHSGSLDSATYAFRELRPVSGRSGYRVIYAFDPKRRAVVLIGGAKTDPKLYQRLIKRAEKIWRAYLAQ